MARVTFQASSRLLLGAHCHRIGAFRTVIETGGSPRGALADIHVERVEARALQWRRDPRSARCLAEARARPARYRTRGVHCRASDQRLGNLECERLRCHEHKPGRTDAGLFVAEAFRGTHLRRMGYERSFVSSEVGWRCDSE